MHSMNQLKQTPLPLRIAFILACFAVSPQVRAVCRDGCDITFGNTFLGDNALFSNISGSGNTAIGNNALYHNTTGNSNTANGDGALFYNTIGYTNTAVGSLALYGLTSGGGNTAVGGYALQSNTIGVNNTATGVYTLDSTTTGNQNTATGVSALLNNTIANNNTADGFQALRDNTGASNTAIGSKALLRNSTGSSNIGLGVSAGANLTTGSNNIAIGNFGVAAESNTIRIGQVQTRTFIKGISGVAIAGAGVVVNANGQLGTSPCSARFKDEITPMDRTSEAILALKPVTFRYKQEIDADRAPQFGLVAEDVEKVNPDLVTRDADGKVYTVRYDAVNAMLLNEFLKEHKKVEEQDCKMQEQEATIAQLRKDLRATVTQLTAQLEEQATQIQRVSAQLEMSKFATGRIRGGGPAPQTVLNSQ